MKKLRLLALVTASVLSLSLLGCSDGIHWRFGQDDESSETSSDSENKDDKDKDDDDDDTPSVDIDTVKEHVEAMLEHTEESGNEQAVSEDIATLINDLDTISEELSYLTMDYYTDWYSTRLEKKYDALYEDYYVAYELISYGFHNGYLVEEYAHLFEPYIDPEYVEYYTDSYMSLRRLEGYTRVDYELLNEDLDEYFDIAYDDDLSDKEKNLRCAELYLTILSDYDTESMYELYNRDYTAENIISLSKLVKEEFLPVSMAYEDVFYDLPDSDELYDGPVGPENPFEAVWDNASRISPEFEKVAKNMKDNSLYVLADGNDCYDGSFTTDLPLQNSSIIYLYQYGDYYDLITAIHESGHHYAYTFDDTSTYLSGNNIDIAEIQSQGLEMLFIPLYQDICGDSADAMAVMNLYSIVDSVLSGFIVGEFELTVLENLDSMTPEDVVELFDELYGEYNPDAELYMISHIFESPGYYISYGVSALASLDIWHTSLTDYDKAVEMYEKIVRVESNDKENTFSASLEKCGFNDVLDNDFILYIADTLEKYADSF